MRILDFSLPDQNNTVHNLKDHKGSWVVVYFYPKDDTPGCTKEACSFRNNLALFQKEKVTIFGISKDSPLSHKKFAEKYHLNFPLLSDESKDTIKAFGAWGKKKFMGREYEGILRKTYIINPEGEIVKEYSNVNPVDHAKEILRDIKTLNH